MSVLDQVRTKFKVPTDGASKTSKSSDCVQTAISRGFKTGKSPSAGFEVPVHTRSNAAGCVSIPPGDPGIERRRAEVLEELERQPKIARAYMTDPIADGTTVVMLAIRGVGSGQFDHSGRPVQLGRDHQAIRRTGGHPWTITLGRGHDRRISWRADSQDAG
jgi:hypothetical protein